ncbi:MAG: 50S ribosomal protein L1 [Alphaproteobacteria bacterium]|nr:50S ribosomal protein L1 [Rickettsiales bacterium]
MSSSKRIRDFVDSSQKLIEQSGGFLSIDQALDSIVSYKTYSAGFDESVDVSVKLGIDPKRGEHVVKTNVVLPNGTGKVVKALVFASGDDAIEAKKLGATYIGLENLIEQIIAGELVPGKDFTSCVATIDSMLVLSKSKAVRILGVAGMMPNSKIGTAAKDIKPILKEVLSGRVELKGDRAAFIKMSIGRISFKKEFLRENLFAVYNAIKLAKPATLKGNLFNSVRLSVSMMGVSFEIKMTDLYASA